MPVERIHFWGISAVWLFYVLAGVSVAIFLVGVGLRVAVWRKGRAVRGPAGPERAPRQAVAGLAILAKDGLFGRRIYRGDPWAGVMHALIMWGFVGLFIGTVLATIDHWFVHFLTGDTYLGYSVCLEVLGLMLAAGLVIAFARRYVVRVRRLQNGPQDLWILVLLFLAVLTGFLVEGTRLAAEMPAWEGPSFTGVGIAAWLPAGDGAEVFYPYIWWVHALICLGLVAYFPFSKLFHSLAAPVNLYLAPQAARGTPPEDRQPGVPEFSFRDLVDLSACTQCGRCQEVCPSASALEPLSPRDFISQAGRYANARFSPLSSGGPLRSLRLWSMLSPARRLRASRPAAEGPKLSPEQIWYCTTCRACLEVCPVYIGAFEPIRRVRTAEIEEGSRVSPLLTKSLETLYLFDNPWEPSKKKRSEWHAGLEVPDLTTRGPLEAAPRAESSQVAGAGSPPLCYWVGCTTSIDTRAQKLARALVRTMAHAGVEFGTLGQKETCCGDIARQVGEEGLFEEQKEKTAALFHKYGVDDVVTSSPHCFDLMTTDYAAAVAGAAAQAGEATKPGAAAGQTVAAGRPAGFRARHYTQLLAELLDAGRLRPDRALDLTVTYHDPCYLGRRNHIYDEPRALIRSIPGLRLVEMAHSGPDSLCCGGGGGRMWQELPGEQKLGEVRIREAAATGAQAVITACPYCLIMLEDAVKTADLESTLRVIDLAELVAASLGLGETEE